MIEVQEMVAIEKRDLVDAVASLRSTGYRLVQICAATLADRYEMNYSFDKDRRFRNLKFAVQPGESIPSISLIYGSAFLYENEIHDLFGITIDNIVIDFHGTLYQTRIPSPFAVQVSQTQEVAGVAETEPDAGKNHG